MSIKIKKVFEPIVALLAANTGVLVEDILEQVQELAAAKSGGGGGVASTFHRNEAGEVDAVLCYYHKLWMDPRVADFGAKKTSASGLNSMCKDGVSKWTKQQREAKNAESEILNLVATGELDAADIPEALAEAKEKASRIEPREDGYGFATLEECLADSAERGL